MSGRDSWTLRLGWAAVVVAIALIVWGLIPRNLPIQGFEVVARYPHDPNAYVQGLLYHDGFLYESTGREGTSSVRKVALESGQVLKETDLPADLFGEGLALQSGRLYQLTWHAQEARVYDLEGLTLQEQLPYEGEGWGLTTDGRYLIRSDGSDLLRFTDPETFEEVRRIRVHVGKEPVEYLNELEYVDGEIFANVWKTDYIARIDPSDGAVLGWIDLTGIFDYAALPDPESVPNGIAWDAEKRRLFVTGKLWPELFEIRITSP